MLKDSTLSNLTQSFRDTARNFDFGRFSLSKTSREDKSFRDKRTQPNTGCARITKWQRRQRGNEWTILQDFCQV